jgi:hypothetical protein
MPTYYDDSVLGHITADEDGTVTHIRHSQELRPTAENIPVAAAGDYLREMSQVLQLDERQLDRVHLRVQDLPSSEQGAEYRLEDEKALFDATTVSFAQTFFGVPVFRRGIAVRIKHGPNRIVGVTNNSESRLEGELPSQERIDFYSKLFEGAGFLGRVSANAEGEVEVPRDVAEAARVVRRTLGLTGRAVPRTDGTPRTGLLNGRFVAYRYQPQLRYAGRPEPRGGDRRVLKRLADAEVPSVEGTEPPFPDVPPVNDSVEPGRTYLTAEMIIRHDIPVYGELVWLILVEVESGSVLYIECQTCFVNGMVFRYDPNVSSGDLTVTSDDGDAILQNHDSSEVLTNLDAPVAGTQNLRGTYVVIQNVEDPNLAAPTRPAGSDFDYAPRTNDFAATCAYYHQTQLFRRIADLGFPIATYFDGTTFPIPIDHRGMGNVINAHWSPNGSGGTGHQCYGLLDTSNLAQPLGRAVDPWVHWHEMGGHGTLGDHVGGGTFGFAHSAGDGLAAIQMDPESALRGSASRFDYAPFHPTIARRFDRTWLWGSVNDDQGYGSEEILATCHFRIYRAIGGDHPDVGRRRFASRAATYLILRATAQLTPGTNPSNWDPVTSTNVPGRGAQLWCEELQEADLENWLSEGLSGGAYNKVVRWAFEEQGSYGGAPPAVDVYIDDGRAGEYQFQQVHWANQSMWNRNAADGLPGHQNAVSGATNYMYVKVKNRGTTASGTVTVKGYHCLPGAGLTWPTDFTVMAPSAGLSTVSIAANNAAEVVLGPFEWVPNENVYGHDCVLMIAETAGDPSNINQFTAGESIQEWRLVPHDNNVGQRNVTIVPGGGGMEALLSSMRDVVFIAGNNLNRPALMDLRVTMPTVLSDKGWSLDVGDAAKQFRLRPGEKRAVHLRLVPGKAFTSDDIRAAGDQAVKVDLLADGMEIGGMYYSIDPDLKVQSGGRRDHSHDCADAARDLLDCLDVGGGNVSKVRVKKISLDLEFDNPHDCC